MTVTFSGTATSQRMYFAFNRLRVGTLNPTKRCFSTSNSILTNQVIENGANNNRIIETEKIFVKGILPSASMSVYNIFIIYIYYSPFYCV